MSTKEEANPSPHGSWSARVASFWLAVWDTLSQTGGCLHGQARAVLLPSHVLISLLPSLAGFQECKPASSMLAPDALIYC